MHTARRMLLLFAFALLAAGCLPGMPTAPATLIPSNTAPAVTDTAVPAETATAPATAIPSATTAPTGTTTTAPAATATTAPAATATTAPTAEGPLEAIAILQPGPASRVTSPFTVTGIADPTFEQSIAITLLSADGTTLATTNAQIGADVGQRGPFSASVAFTVASEQQAFLQVYSISAKDGGVTHLSSVGLTLLPPGGTPQIVQAQETTEQIRIDYPTNGTTISGGTLHVEGFALASFEQTLVIDIIDENGTVLSSTPVTVSSPEMGQPGPFQVDIPYSITRENAARVAVRDVSPAHGGNSHLSSVEVRLMP